VNLLLAETYWKLQSVGARVFNVKGQGNLVFQNLDIYATVGANTALVKGFDVSVTNGAISIEFDNVVDKAKVDAIEILPVSSTPTMTLNFVYPDGTPVVGALNYNVSAGSVTLSGSAPLLNGQVSCVLFSAPSALGLIGQLQVNLNLTDSAGHTLWQLNTTFNPTNVSFGAIQNSSLNVTVQKI
jgi:hypothetical protein